MPQQYSIPLFIEEESKIMGPLSLSQFMIVGIPAAISLILLLTTQNLLYFFGILVLLEGPALYLALGKINGEKVPKIIFLAFKFFIQPKIALWQKRGEEGLTLKETKKIIEEKQKIEKQEFRESKLKQIAWQLETGKKQ
ncbi:MAG TPA: hypothetical protein PLL80_00310 [Candidatus Pacearchaeota archaeon]|nr:hypothetical protein [Candidatus Pacearchaeota archaeon]HOK93973.1 hypothetical protein [Candidatus Pacearchaeota archaeon]HPO75044.1 hypothetical protein [Candidatus Pacearchaeota archaeon]